MQSQPPPFAFPLRYRCQAFVLHELVRAIARRVAEEPILRVEAAGSVDSELTWIVGAAVNVRAHDARREGKAEVKVRAEEADAGAVARERDAEESREQ